MYEKYLEQLEEAGKIRNLKELTCQDVRAFLLAKKEEGLCDGQ